jgi:hypothetical protein
MFSSERKNDNTSTYSTLLWMFNKTVSLITYPITHPYKTITFLLCLNVAREIIEEGPKFLQEKFDIVIKYPIDTLQETYNGPTFIYVPDSKFDPTLDIAGWVTDHHPKSYYDDNEKSAIYVTASFNTDNFSKKDQEGLFKERYEFYRACSLNLHVAGNYHNLLSHRSYGLACAQSLFGFYGERTIESFSTNDKGFFVGIRAFGNEGYYSHTNNNKTTYQLVKIDMRRIDFEQIKNAAGQHNRHQGIAHVYVKDGVVSQHPDFNKNEFCPEGWSKECYQYYIEKLPNFSSTVDWVIKASDLLKIKQGNTVENLIDNRQINILEWQKKQKTKSRLPVEKDRYRLFSLPRPPDYSGHYEGYKYDEHGQPRDAKPLRFKTGTT